MRYLLLLIIIPLLFISFISCEDEPNNPLNQQIANPEIPVVDLVAPIQNEEIIEGIYVLANASDNKGITKVEFIVDTIIEKTWVVSPYTFFWSVSKYANGSIHSAYAKAYDGDGNIGTSKLITFSVVKLYKPSGLKINIISKSSVKLNWNDNNNAETGFIVERSTNNNYDFQLLANIDANVTEYYDNTIDTSYSYHYRVKAVKDEYSSDYSNIAGMIYKPVIYERELFIDTHIWVYSVDISTDGNMILAGLDGDIGSIKSVKTYRRNDGGLLQSYDAHLGSVRCVSFSPDDSKFSSGDSRGKFILWDINSTSPIYITNAHNSNWTRTLDYSNDGNIIATGGYDNLIKLWNESNGTHIRTLSGHTDWITSVKFTPDDNKLISCSYDGTINIWGTNDGQLIHTLSGHTDKVLSIDINPSGNMLASGSSDGTVKLWDLASGTLLETIVISGTGAIAFSPNGNLLATGGGQSISIYNVVEHKIYANIYDGAPFTVWSLKFTPDNSVVIGGGAIDIIKQVPGRWHYWN